MAISEYEQQRQRNIENNKKLLQNLGLDQGFIPPKEKSAPAPRKRKATEPSSGGLSENDEERTKKKIARRVSAPADVGSDAVRRSQRNAGKTVDYKAEKNESLRTLRYSGPMDSEPRSSSKRRHDPNVFGHIPGVPVNSWWESRELCSNDAIHAPWVGGISGSKTDGAYSVALSGGYDDDVDLGYGFTYTGSGGRDLKGTKNKPKNLRTAPQSSDQTFENSFNMALKVSSETKKPVRVIRGFKLQSPYAPKEGYRYDGLYTVEKAWQEKGLNPGGFLVCKYAFKRLPGQPPIPERDLAAEARVEEGDDDDDSTSQNVGNAGMDADGEPENHDASVVDSLADCGNTKDGLVAGNADDNDAAPETGSIRLENELANAAEHTEDAKTEALPTAAVTKEPAPAEGSQPVVAPETTLAEETNGSSTLVEANTENLGDADADGEVDAEGDVDMGTGGDTAVPTAVAQAA